MNKCGKLTSIVGTQKPKNSAGPEPCDRNQSNLEAERITGDFWISSAATDWEWVVVVITITPNPIISGHRNIFRVFFWYTNRYNSTSYARIIIIKFRLNIEFQTNCFSLVCVSAWPFVCVKENCRKKLLLNYIIWRMRIPFMSIAGNKQRNRTQQKRNDCAPHRLNS